MKKNEDGNLKIVNEIETLINKDKHDNGSTNYLKKDFPDEIGNLAAALNKIFVRKRY